MVGRRDDEDRVGVAAGARRLEGGELQGRRGVASERLEQDARRLDADRAQLLDDREAMLLVGDHACGGCSARPAMASVARRCAACWNSVSLAGADAERQVLLGMERPAQRPEARAAAAGEDHRYDGEHGAAVMSASFLVCEILAQGRDLRAQRDVLAFLAREERLRQVQALADRRSASARRDSRACGRCAGSSAPSPSPCEQRLQQVVRLAEADSELARELTLRILRVLLEQAQQDDRCAFVGRGGGGIVGHGD